MSEDKESSFDNNTAPFERDRPVEGLADHDIGVDDLVEVLERLYEDAGRPYGPGPEGLCEWIQHV